MAVDVRIAHRFNAFRRMILKVATSLNEIDVYARRLQSLDQLTPKELAVYVTRRRQALLFFATQNDPALRNWKDAHPGEARFCTELGWASIPTSELSQSSAPLTVAQQANAMRVLSWWSKGEQHDITSPRQVTRRVKHVGNLRI